MTLYNIFPTSQGLRITKWDSDMNVEASYLVSDHGCECPATKPCKHMSMMKMMKADNEIGKNTFYDPVSNDYFELDIL
jgi:hypothetical protein